MRKSKPIGGIGSERKKKFRKKFDLFSLRSVWATGETVSAGFSKTFAPAKWPEGTDWDLGPCCCFSFSSSSSSFIAFFSAPKRLQVFYFLFFCSLPFHILSVSSCCLSSSCLSTLQSLESCGTIAKNNTKRFQLSIIISCAFDYFDGYLLLTNNGCHTLGYVFKTNIFPEKTNIRWLCAFFSASMWVDDDRCVLGTTSIETPG